MTSAMDELRRMLDERGVAHIDIGGMTEFAGLNGRICRAYTRPEPITVDVDVIAAQPEQAISATLGDGTLQAENAELRELVDFMTPIAWYGASERERDRMRELGIEVDG